MRKIKFRVWNKIWEMISPVDTLIFENDSIISCSVTIKASDYDHKEEWKDYKADDEIVLMQFTGLLDKNGKEIYEGDIVKYVGQLYPDRFKIYEIKWDDKLAGFYAGGGQLRRASSYEVIGNVYENSELIN